MEEKKDENTIYIGKKEMATYELAVVRKLDKGVKELSLQSMGRNNAILLDLVEILKRKDKINVLEIKTDTMTKPVHDEGKDPYDRKITTLEVKISPGK